MNNSALTPYESIASLGASFAKYRKSLKISQQRLHEKTGISIFTISQFENGKGQGLSLSHFLLLLDAVGLDISLTNLIPIASVIDPEKRWKSSAAHLQSSVFKLSKDLIDSIHEEGIVAYTS